METNKSNPKRHDECPHENVMGETFAGRSTGDRICRDCGAIFSSRLEAREAKQAYREKHCHHERVHDEVISGQRTGEVVCDECGKDFSSASSWESYRETQKLKQHQKQETDMSKFDEIANAPKDKAAEMIRDLADQEASDLVNGEEMSGIIADTNAFGWVLDVMEIDKDSIDVDGDTLTCSAHVSFAGE